ncbi:MFS transporter [Cryptosporangium phraense]|uniref:MFS transporter n=1 Tax=Cryptosporangium phraense TaxID=2593070 RepID=A0A545AZL5_9ACTN|nr:MFS transporter [Cryptosporangium phraense]TQS46781.1 MFS transporter [Cryptosporangium phraense]
MADGTGLRMGTAQGRWVLLATVLGSSLVMLDGTVVNVALERIGHDLDADFAGLQWIVNAYTLTLAALILLGGALGDRFGRRRVFIFGVIWFAVASLFCALAPSAGLLALAQALQGIGGALLTPGSLAMIAATFDPRDRSRAVGAWSAFGGIAGAIGPFVGGWLVEWDWRTVFLLNLPLAVVVVVIARVHVPETRDTSSVRGFDVSGTVLGAAGLGVLTYGLIAGGRGFGPFVWTLVAAGVVLLAGFLLVERRSPHPLVPLDLFTNRMFTAINGVTFLVYAALGVFFFLLVLQLQVVAGFSPIAAGTALLPVTAIMLTFSSRSGALADRIGARIPLTVGPLVAAGGLLLATRIGPGATYLGSVLPAVVLFGAGLSLTVAPLTATVLGSAEARHAGIASGVNNAVARAAGLLSVAVIPVVAGLSGQAYADPGAMSDGFRMAMMVCAALLVVGGVLSFTTIRAGAPVGAGPAAAGSVGADAGAPTGAPGAPAAGAAVPGGAVPGGAVPGAAVAGGGVPGALSDGDGPGAGVGVPGDGVLTGAGEAPAAVPVGSGAPVGGAPVGGAPVGAAKPAAEPAKFDLAQCLHCGVTGPQLYPDTPFEAPASRG